MRIFVRLLESSATSSLDAPADDAFLFFAIILFVLWLVIESLSQELPLDFLNG